MHRYTALPPSASSAGAGRQAESCTGRTAATAASASAVPSNAPAIEHGTGTGTLPVPPVPAGSDVLHAPAPEVVPLTARRLCTGIPRLDRFLDGGCESGRITLLEGPPGFVMELTSRFAVNGVARLRRPVMLIDGGNSADPYGFSTACRRAHLDAREVLEQIYIARAFTVYQLDTLLTQMVEKRINALSPALVIVSCLNTMYLDPDVKWEEAQALFHNDIRILRELTRKYQVATLITNHTGQKSYNVMELERTLRTAAEHCIDVKARSRYKLRLVRNNGAAVLDYRPLPRYQCSLDEFCPGGILDG